MLSLDDRTGNVLTTVGLFAAVVGIAYAARATLVVLVLAMLLAYLLEPAVGWVQHRLPLTSNGRLISIALIYAIGTSLLVGAAYTLEPTIARQIQRLNDVVPDLRARFADSQFLAEHGSAIVGPVERAGQAVAAAAEYAGWLLMVPVIAIFFLRNRQGLIDSAVDLFARRRDRATVKRTIEQVDTMLAQYTRAQSATAVLSAVFYCGSMALLKFPYPLALGLFGGVLEFVPFAGWIVAGAAILTSGWLAHSHWIWMAGLIVVWRIVMNVVISPRIMGDRLQMEPMTVFLALLAGGQIAGLIGVILSVPAVAVLRILWLERSSRENVAAA